MSYLIHREAFCGLILSLLLVFLNSAATAQTPAPTSFTYQGFLQQADNPAEGSFDFRFTLHDAAGGGTQVGPAESRTLTVQSGVFYTTLDFGAVFDRALWLNVEVRTAGTGTFTALTPRTALTSVPYANSVAGGLLSGDVVSAQTAYSFAGQRVLRQTAMENPNGSSLHLGLRAGEHASLSAGLNTFVGHAAGEHAGGERNTFVGALSGQENTTGSHNAFFGAEAGRNTTVGVANSFFGSGAGRTTTTGGSNSFFGQGAGILNSTGSHNSFFGNLAGQVNNVDGNSFFGANSGWLNTTGADNAFFGALSGFNNRTGSDNSFFGAHSGRENSSGLRNSFFGAQSGRFTTTGQNNSFFGNRAGLSNSTGNSNSMFGNVAGQLNTSGSQNSFFGNGAGHDNTSGSRNVFVGLLAGRSNTSGNDNTIIGFEANLGAGNLTNATAIGAGAVVSQSNSLVLGNNANVGIGTPAPGSKLTVTGIIESTTGGIKFPDGSVQTTAGGGGSGTANAILNQSTLQTGANFNISGTGQAYIFEAASHFNIFGEHILSTRTDLQSLYIGSHTGINATGQNNTFVGIRAGFSMTTGQNNTFFGRRAGHDNTSGGSNVYFGDSAGEYNTGGHSNVALGGHSGQFNQGSFNAFVGWGAGSNNVGGNSNSALGYEANFDAPGLQFATAIGAGAMVASSNTIVLGRPADNVEVPGTLIKSAGSFRIDHPLDPANKYLSHSFVESPDMMNVYNGNIILDNSGEAWIEMPAYFEALNREFRYQLTAIGAPGPNLYVADEITGNRFRVSGGAAGMKVSWQVTGIRKDPYAEWNPIIVEQDKPEAERGRTTTFPTWNSGSNLHRTNP